jgi:hypothetical protein
MDDAFLFEDRDLDSSSFYCGQSVVVVESTISIGPAFIERQETTSVASVRPEEKRK